MTTVLIVVFALFWSLVAGFVLAAVGAPNAVYFGIGMFIGCFCGAAWILPRACPHCETYRKERDLWEMESIGLRDALDKHLEGS